MIAMFQKTIVPCSTFRKPSLPLELNPGVSDSIRNHFVFDSQLAFPPEVLCSRNRTYSSKDLVGVARSV